MPARRFTAADHERMAELRERGMSVLRIARDMGCSKGLVAWVCLKLGADPPKARPLKAVVVGPVVMQRGGHVVRRFTPAEDACLLELSESGLGNSEIAASSGAPRIRSPGG